MLSLALGAFAVTVCSGAPPAPPAVATFSNGRVLASDFVRVYRAYLKHYAPDGITGPLAEAFGAPALVVESIIDAELFAREAETRGFTAAQDAGPEARQAELVEQLIEALKRANTVSDDEAAERAAQVADRLQATIYEASTDDFLDEVPAPDKGEVETWTSRHESELRDAYERYASQEAQKSSIAEKLWRRDRARALARIEARRILAEARRGPPFAGVDPSWLTSTREINRTASDAASLPDVPELRAALFARKSPGVVNKVFERGESVFVVAVTRRSRTRVSAEDRARARLEIERERLTETIETLRQSLRSQANIVIDTGALNRLSSEIEREE